MKHIIILLLALMPAITWAQSNKGTAARRAAKTTTIQSAAKLQPATKKAQTTSQKAQPTTQEAKPAQLAESQKTAEPAKQTEPAKAATSATMGDANSYTVKKGDYFGKIAKNQGTTVADLVKANPGVSSNKLQDGQVIKLHPQESAEATHIATPSKVDTKAPAKAVAKPATSAPKQSNKQTIHIVKKGEILGTIARKYGITVVALRKANPSIKGDKIRDGIKLVIPAKPAPKKDSKKSPVKPGRK